MHPAKNDIVKEEICQDLEGLANPGVSETQGVTTFVNEAAICAEVPNTALSTGFASPVSQFQDLKEYFARPRLIVSGNAANVRGPRWGAGITPNQLFNPTDLGSWFPDGSNRLMGVAGVRFNIKFTLVVTANPFHQGIMVLAFQYGKSSFGVDVYNRANIASAVTQLPHVRLDFAEQTMVTLDVPFVYQYDYFPLDDRSLNYPAMGWVSVSQLMQCPILTSSANATWKVFVSLHDLELIGSIPRVRNTVTPQSGLSRAYNAAVSGANTMLSEAKATGAISKFSNAAADAVSTLASNLPSLASIGGPTAWFLRLVGKAASAFGYSKPNTENEPAKHWRTDNIHDMNVDVANPSLVVGAFQTNRLRVDSTLGGTDTDEMALNYVLSKYSQIFLGSVATTDATGTTLYASNNTLMNYWFRTTTSKPGGNLPIPTRASTTFNAVQPSALCYFGSMFRQWRGGLKYRITFAKTKFHAGRIMLAFIPSPKPGADHGTITDTVAEIPESYAVVGGTMPQPFGYTMMLDLRDQSVFEFEVPYLAPVLYTSVFGSTGSLSLTVVDPLIANGEAATSVDYLIEVAAMDDFEFAVPAPPIFTPVPNPSSGVGFPTPQSGLAVDNKRETCEYAVGEKFTSLKQLIMMPTYTAYDVANLTTSTTSLPFWWFFPRWSVALPMVNPNFQVFGLHRGGLVAACYAFVHGSTNVHVYNDAGGSKGVSMGVMADPYDGAGTDLFDAPTVWNRGKAFASRVLYHTTQSVMHAVLPQHSNVARITIDNVFDAAQSSGRNFVPGTRNIQYPNSGAAVIENAVVSAYDLVVRNTSGGTLRFDIGIGAGDDARAAGYIGVPPILLFNSSQTVSSDSYLAL